MAQVTHIDAAVVRLRTASLVRKMTPAPRNPMPTTTWDATRVTSTLTLVLLRSETTNSSKPSVDTIPKMAAPRHTAMWVRRPAGWSLTSRSIPTAAPSRTATRRRTSASSGTSNANTMRRGP